MTMKATKENKPISLDYLGLDKCSNEMERASLLWMDIVRRKDELTQVKTAYQNAYKSIIAQWKDEINDRFHDIQVTKSSYGEIGVDFVKGSLHYEVCIGKDQKNLFCLVLLDSENVKKNSVIPEEIVSKLKDLLSWKKSGYCLFEEFNINDFEKAFSCYIKVIDRFVDLTKE